MVRFLIQTVCTLFVTLVCLSIFLFVGSGKNQQISVEKLERRLKLGISITEAEAITSPFVSIVKKSNETAIATVAESGFSELFWPQKDIFLTFEDGKLTRGTVKFVFQANDDESQLQLAN